MFLSLTWAQTSFHARVYKRKRAVESPKSASCSLATTCYKALSSEHMRFRRNRQRAWCRFKSQVLFWGEPRGNEAGKVGGGLRIWVAR